MSTLKYVVASARKSLIIECHKIITDPDSKVDNFSELLRFLGNEYQIADRIVKAESNIVCA